jgi:hypothetical protein
METPLFTLERILPEQFGPRRRGLFQDGGVGALMSAILEDAIHCFQRQFAQSNQHTKQLAAEAEEWIFADDLEWPFSFLNICLALDLDPQYLRTRLRQWYECPPDVRRKRGRKIVLAERISRPAAAEG